MISTNKFDAQLPLCAVSAKQQQKRREGCLADRKTACVRAPAVTVGWINSQAAAASAAAVTAAAAGGVLGAGWAGHIGRLAAGSCEPVVCGCAAYRTHEYNWSITTARALSITLDLGWRAPSVRSLSLHVAPHKGTSFVFRASLRWRGHAPMFDIPLERAEDAGGDGGDCFPRYLR